MSAKFLQQSKVVNIAREAIDKQTISEDSRIAFNRATSAFLLFLGGAAEEIVRKKKKKTIGVVEMMEALQATDFGEFAATIQQQLEEDAKKRTQQASNDSNDADVEVNEQTVLLEEDGGNEDALMDEDVEANAEMMELVDEEAPEGPSADDVLAGLEAED